MKVPSQYGQNSFDMMANYICSLLKSSSMNSIFTSWGLPLAGSKFPDLPAEQQANAG